MLRNNTNIVKIRQKYLGGNNPVLVQTMAKEKTSHIDNIIKLAGELDKIGCDLLRVAVLDDEDADALAAIVDNSPLPIIADLHFSKELAMRSLKSGVDKIRINPGNFNPADLKDIIDLAKTLNTPIRIGLNSGSLSTVAEYNAGKINSYFQLLDSTLQMFRDADYTKNLVLGLKSTDPTMTYNLNKAAAEIYPYPLHIGVTESGYGSIGAIRSAIALVPLLKEGIGNTIRISLSDSPEAEVEAGLALLKGLGLRNNVPTLITCPTCGRTQSGVQVMARRVGELLKYVKADIKVAVMGCPVNGPGEAKNADFGLAGTQDAFLTFRDGRPGQILKTEEAYRWIEQNLAIYPTDIHKMN